MEPTWEMWRKKKGATWRDNFESLGQCVSFDDIRRSRLEFLTARYASDEDRNSSFLLFKKGIRPEWEDPANRNGGRWATYGLLGQVDPDIINQQWYTLLTTILDPNFIENSKHICGCEIDIRLKNYRISIWTKDKNDSTTCLRIGQAIRNVLSTNSKWKYEDHQSNDLHRASWKVQPLYSLE